MDLDHLRGQSMLDASCPLPVDRPFTAAQARNEGVPKHQLTWLVKHGFLRIPIRGVFLATQAGDSTLLRCQCLSLVVPDDCVICDRHAGWLLGAEMILAPNEHLDLRPISVFRPSGRGRLRNGLAHSGERNLRPGDVTEVHGLRVTTPLRTAWDLGRVRSPDQAIAGLDAMLRTRTFTRNELLAGVERFRRMRYITVLRAIAPLADGRAASPGESVLRLRWIQASLPEPEPQLEVLTSIGLAILDLGCSELRYGAEYDGEEWHTDPSDREHDRIRRRALQDDDWLVDVFVKTDLWGPKQNAETRLRDGVAEARRRCGLRAA